MSKKYTAQEMRFVADNVCSDYTFALINVGSVRRPVYREIKPYEVAYMLRQAADFMEQESDVVQCRRCQTARSGEGYGDTPPPIGDDSICDRCEIAKRIRENEEVKK